MRAGDAAEPGPDLSDEGDGLCRGSGGCRSRDDGPGGGSVSPSIHPTALIDPSAELGKGVAVGPYTIVGPNVMVGDGCRLGARVTLQRNVRLAGDGFVGAGSVPGGGPRGPT